jgi:hypothetical protein
VTPSRVAPGVFGSGNFPGLASPQPSGRLAIAAKSGIKKRQRLKFGLLLDRKTPGGESHHQPGIRSGRGWVEP